MNPKFCQSDPGLNPNRPQTNPKPNPKRHQTHPKPWISMDIHRHPGYQMCGHSQIQTVHCATLCLSRRLRIRLGSTGLGCTRLPAQDLSHVRSHTWPHVLRKYMNYVPWYFLLMFNEEPALELTKCCCEVREAMSCSGGIHVR